MTLQKDSGDYDGLAGSALGESVTLVTGGSNFKSLRNMRRPQGGAKKRGSDPGEIVYRIHGGESPQWGHSWTSMNPLDMLNPRSELGLPKANAGEYVTCARVCNNDGVVERDALRLDGNPGGGPELLFPNPEQQLQHLWTVWMEPPL